MIEKLGMTAGHWEYHGLAGVDVGAKRIVLLFGDAGNEIEVDVEEVRHNGLLIAAAPEMLEALIDIMPFIEEEHYARGGNAAELKDYPQVRAIEKATGKTLEEVEELIK